MAEELPIISLQAIGTVSNGISQPPPQGWTKVISDIVVDPELSEALDNLDEFSHIIVLYWMHRPHTEPPPTKVHPRGNRKIPLKGALATRSPHRPNPLGKALVRLVQRQDNVLTVKGLDAFDGTPVIDIKPYIPGYDSVANATVAPWITSE